MVDGASDCDLIDLAAIAEIQSEGFLVCTHFQRDSMRLQIRNVSSNIGEAPFSLPAVRKDPHLLIGRCVPECFSESFADRLSALFQKYLGNRSTRCSYTCDSPRNTKYLVTIAKTRDGLVFEVLPDDESPLGTFEMGHGGDLCALTVHTDQAALFKAACAAVTNFVSYDRSMIYQFQDDLSGKVVYEDIKPLLEGTLEPYVNTFFPESDIPLPARQMFLIHPVRVMFDNDLSPVKIIGNDIDTSKCVLRSSHPVHRSYMQNMGVRSSLSIGIVVNSELWGLMCFHSYGNSAVHPTGREIGHFENLSTQVSVCLSNIQRATSVRRQTALSAIVDKGLSTDDIFAFFTENAPDLIRLTESDCVSIRLGRHQIKHWGDADLVLTGPDLDRVSKSASEKNWCLEEIDRPSRGVLGIVHDNLVVVFVRRSIASDKVWAGDPTCAKIMRPDGVPGPRGSFERYIQSGADRLNRWTTQHREMATYLSSRIKILVSTAKFFADKTVRKTPANVGDDDGYVRYNTEKTPVSLDAALISHFSHELKTPLHGVSSVLTLLSEEHRSIGNADMQTQLGYGLECLGTISKVVESVLAAAAGGRVHRKIESVCLELFVDSIAKKYVDSNKLTVTITVPKSYTRVMVDADLLRKTICGIIDNSTSAKYMNKPTHLSLSCCSTHREAIMAWKSRTKGYAHRNIRNSEDTSNISDSDWWYTFSVQDPGCGIHGDMIDNVLAFNDGSRIRTTITNSHQGVGVGVYSCIANVFELNGSIGIASTVSKGTIVSVMLPAKVVVTEENTVQVVPEAENVFFVVDDNTVNRRLASRLVKVAFRKTTGVTPQVKDFADGRLCIEEIKRVRKSGKKILGVLMDHHMPVMSGKEATQYIRNMEAHEGIAKIPIFGFTADSTDSTKEELLKAGMDDVLPKPMSMKVLEQTCIKMMSRKEISA